MTGRGITYDLGDVGDVVECSSVLVLVVGAEIGIEGYTFEVSFGTHEKDFGTYGTVTGPRSGCPSNGRKFVSSKCR
jgi:hypothetical protein